MKESEFIWAALLHMGYNMWSDVPVPFWGPKANRQTDPEQLKWICAADHLRFDEAVWRKVTAHMAERGMNMIVIDIGEALQLKSHPELAVKGSWEIDRFRQELARLRGMGLEPIPKLNFSTSHDTWLKEYHRMVSTPEYYKVCSDVIREVWEIFDKPRLFHLGYDEETMGNQYVYSFAAVRQGELWWHDFLWFNETVKKAGSRSWIWSDYGWRHKDEFLARMPREVLQSNWYYYHIDDEQDKEHLERIAFFDELDKAGFDQIPCGSAYSWKPNFTELVRYCRKNLAGSPRLKGFMLAPWTRTWNRFHDRNAYALEAFEMGKNVKFLNKKGKQK